MDNIKIPETPVISSDTAQNTPMNKVNDTLDYLNENASVEKVRNASTEAIKKISNDNMFIGLALLLIFSSIVAYILYVYITKNVFNQAKVTIQSTKTPIVCNKQGKYPIKEFNKSGNGKRRTYTFWIYIHDMNKYHGSYKHVFHIGDTNEIKNASPYVFLDKHENILYIRFGSVSDDTFNNTTKSVQNLTDSQLNEFMKQGIKIPYIPIQRWVHVGVVINENSNNGTITAYIDGDLSTSVSTQDSNDNGEGTSKYDIKNLNLDKQGDLHTGGSFESYTGPGFSGLLSKVSMFNYDLNNKDIYTDYNKGPLDGLMASLGLSNYGVRTPIYKIE
jgi:hypothetical protein